ncbi:penicillin-binding protein 1B [Vibrio viridaestus]|uniref:Penicillin-binding protein 1B n=1 Tax=Vibrio viridaestus TaxID=2487322 RepID=A0A3N9TJT8_9VIBR|nr:penicillin-binding protein 1B [Vibrio viridaestus]RQW63835.1 penicillin-binding protein 1B [Vibrio viridaestus]
MTNKKSPQKPPAKKKAPNKQQNQSGKSIWKRLWQIGWKVGITVFTLVIAYGFYLNNEVKQRFEGQLFQLPTVVYARILDLSPGDNISINDVRKELDVLNYRKVAQPQYEGEYSASSSKLEIIRRPFEFADGPEPARHIMLYFNGNELSRIKSLDQNADLGFVRLEPKMLGMLEKNSSEQRLFLRREQFPEVMIDALLVTEDRNFYHHDGVSPLAIARAMVVNLKAGRTVQGGSTLTQQLAKNIFLSNKRTIWRKLQEAYMAVIIDYKYSKDRILEAYLNEVYLGQNGAEAVHGFGLASRLYFGQPIQELRIDQLALLVGMVKGPSYYNPARYPERAKVRRDLVLKLMLQQDILTASQYAQAVQRPLDVQKNPHIARRQPAYFQQLANELQDKVGDKFKSDVGLKVFSTLDPVSQEELETAVSKTLPKFGNSHLQAASIAVDRSTGEIRAMVGGKNARFDGFNRVLNAKRQIGSLAKPAVYLTALSHPDTYNLATTLKDTPIKLKSDKGNIWEPQNFDRQFRGDVPLYLGLAKSINVPTVKLGMSLGINQVSKTFVKLGIDPSELRPVPSMFLGAFSLAPIQVAQMFQTITNSGRKVPLSALRSVIDLDGNVLYQSVPKGSQAVQEQAAWLTTYAMKRGVMEGTGRYLNSRFGWAALAGKTGTSNDTRDSWFVGVDGREVTTTWVGRDDDKSTGLTGASGALRVYADYLSRRTPEQLSLPWPAEIKTVGFDKESSGTLSLECSDDDFTLPVWDKDGSWAKQCKEQQKPLNWIKRLFSW